jgi:hypothetical protein
LLKSFYKLSDEEWDVKKNIITKEDKEEIMKYLGKMDK